MAVFVLFFVFFDDQFFDSLGEASDGFRGDDEAFLRRETLKIARVLNLRGEDGNDDPEFVQFTLFFDLEGLEVGCRSLELALEDFAFFI